MHALMIRFLGLALVAVLATACQSDEEKLAEHMSRGDSYVENEDWNEAIIEYMGVLQIDPNDGEAHYKLAKAYFKVNKVREGYWELRETVRLAPENLVARVELGIMLMYAKEFDESLSQFDAVIAAEPENVRAHALRAQVLDLLKRPDEALEEYAKAVELDDTNRDALLLYASALARRGARDDAAVWYVKLTDTYPDYPAYSARAKFTASLRDAGQEAEVGALFRKAIELAKPEEKAAAYSDFASYLYESDRVDDAIAVLEEGVEQSDDKLQLIYTLARFYTAKGDTAKADALIEQATVAVPDQALPFLNLSAHRDRNGDLPGALEAAQKAAEIEPENIDAKLRIAEVSIQMGMRDKDEEKIATGREIVEGILAASPDHPGALTVKAKIDLYEKNPDAAIASLRAAVNARPDWAPAHFILGTALALKGDDTGARSELARALEIDPSLLAARRVLTQVHADLRENEYAIEEGRRYLRERPDDVEMRILVAQSLIRLGKREEAERELEAIPEGERTPEINYAYGRIAMGKGDFDAARRYLHKALEALPTNYDVLNSLYLLDRAENAEPGESVALIEKALEAEPESPRLIVLQGTIALAQRRGEDAEAAFKRAIEIDPESLTAYESLARYYSATGRLQEAIDTYEAAVVARPQAAQIYHLLGVLYELGGKQDKAIANYEKAIEQSPNLGEAKNNLAYLFAESGKDLDRALELAQEAKALLPDNSNAADTLGWVLYKRGVPGAAISYLREAVATAEPGSATLGLVRYHLALAYQKNGEDEQAAETLERALADLDAQSEDLRSRGMAADEPAWASEARALLSELQRS